MGSKSKLEEQLLAELSRRNTDLIVLWIEENPEFCVHLVDYILSHHDPLSWRSAWVLEKITERKRIDISPYLPKIIAILSDIPLSGTRRIVAKILMLEDLPKAQEGEVLNFALTMLESPKEPVAVKANCMTIVFKLLADYPELKDEIFAIIEDQIPHNSDGFKSRFNVLKRKYKLG